MIVRSVTFICRCEVIVRTDSYKLKWFFFFLFLQNGVIVFVKIRLAVVKLLYDAYREAGGRPDRRFRRY